MKRILFLLSALVLSLLALLSIPTNSAIQPRPRDPQWMARHLEFVERAHRGGIDVLFLGDSIVDYWQRPDKGLPVWEREFVPRGAVNFGISGDRTQHVLWRLRNGEADGFQPKVIVLLVGTNNTALQADLATPQNSVAQIFAGISAIVHELRSHFPEAAILLHGLFPRGDPGDPQRAQTAAINASIARLHDGVHVIFVDFGSRFLDADGRLLPDVMSDKLHPDLKGYEIWADALREPLAALLPP